MAHRPSAREVVETDTGESRSGRYLGLGPGDACVTGNENVAAFTYYHHVLAYGGTVQKQRLGDQWRR